MAMKNVSELGEGRPYVDLTGPNGNAFVLLGYAKQWGKDLGMTNEETKSLQTEMMSGDYENLLAVLEREFGDYVDFYQ